MPVASRVARSGPQRPAKRSVHVADSSGVVAVVGDAGAGLRRRHRRVRARCAPLSADAVEPEEQRHSAGARAHAVAAEGRPGGAGARDLEPVRYRFLRAHPPRRAGRQDSRRQAGRHPSAERAEVVRRPAGHRAGGRRGAGERRLAPDRPPRGAQPVGVRRRGAVAEHGQHGGRAAGAAGRRGHLLVRGRQSHPRAAAAHRRPGARDHRAALRHRRRARHARAAQRDARDELDGRPRQGDVRRAGGTGGTAAPPGALRSAHRAVQSRPLPGPHEGDARQRGRCRQRRARDGAPRRAAVAQPHAGPFRHRPPAAGRGGGDGGVVAPTQRR